MLTFLNWLRSFFKTAEPELPQFDYTDVITAYRDAIIADAGFLDRYNHEVLGSRVLKIFAEVALLPNAATLSQWYATMYHLNGRLLELPLPDDVRAAINRIIDNCATYFGEYVQ